VSKAKRPGTDLDALAATIGHVFRSPVLLLTALTHAGAARNRDRANERLEFLGDRVLGLIIADALLARFPGESEGALAKRLAALVSRDTLAGVAGEIELGRFLVLTKGDAAAGNRQHAGILADALEAVIAALYLDGGLEAARTFVLTHWGGLMAPDSTPPRDAKTRLQELTLARSHDLPHYRVLRREGPDHQPQFEVEVTIDGARAVGSGPSKRQAEQQAAASLLGQIEAEQHG
jgi:ribonuclease-3